jgi:hypothetical protein
MSKPTEHTVHIRLIGTPQDVAFWLQLLEELGELDDVTDPEPARHNKIRVYAIVTRRAPLKGFPR